MKKLVISYLKQSKAELNIAKKLLEEAPFASIFHAQQASELAIKSFLIAKGYREIRKHIVSGIFVKSIESEKEPWKSKLDSLLPLITQLESYGTTARYPFESRGEILIPSEEFKAKDAKNAMKKAKEVFGIIEEYLKEVKGIQL